MSQAPAKGQGMEDFISDFVLEDENGKDHFFELLDLVEREENDYMVLLDEDGEERTFEVLSLVERKGTEYLVLLPVGDESVPPKVVVLAVVESEEDSEDDYSVDDYEEMGLQPVECKTLYHVFYDVEPSHTDYGDVLQMAPEEIDAFLESEDAGDCAEGMLETLEEICRWNREARAGATGSDPTLHGVVIHNSPYTKKIIKKPYEEPDMSAERRREIEALEEGVLSGAIDANDLSLDDLCEVGSSMRDRREGLERRRRCAAENVMNPYIGGKTVESLKEALYRFRSRLR